MSNLITSYSRQGFTFVAEGPMHLDGVDYKTLFFNSPAKGNLIVLVSSDGLMYQEYQANQNTGLVSKDFPNV